jgi:TonB-linked SusC/RagA family outer membrane protein
MIVKQRIACMFTGMVIPLLILFCCLPETGSAQERKTSTIRGLVENEKGEKLQGVNVLLKNDSTGFKENALTNEEGIFVFSNFSQSSYELMISYVGYESQTIRRDKLKPGREESHFITMKITSVSMEALVVVGYGSQKRKDITGAVSTVSRERLERSPNLNIAQALQGAVAGFIVQQNEAGAASGESLMVRGRKSILASNNPLLVVDGIPYGGQIRDINVNDVLSIEVLKDASAAAIYGSRGSNGVILITTRTGSKGKPVIAYDGRYGMQKAIHVPEFMNAQEFYEFKNIREPGKVTASEQAIYDAGKGVDWAGYALRNGNSQQHNISVSGGFQETKYYIGGSYLDVKGVTMNDKYSRYTFRMNLDTKIAKWLTIGTRTQLGFDDRGGATINWEDVLRTNPLTQSHTDAGELTIYPWEEFTDIGNPLEPLYYDNKDKSFQIVTNNYAVVDFPFIKGLSYRINTGIRKTSTDVSNYIGRNTKTGLEARGVATTLRRIEDNTVIENILSYSREFGDHTISATGLYSYESNTGSSNSATAKGFPHDFLTYYSMAQAEQITPEYDYFQTNLISQMLRVNYSYDSRYLLTITGRRDGYSGFGANNKWGVFPSVAVGWNIEKENFFPQRSVIDRLKLRASYGKNGNQAVNAYESISRLGENNMVALSQTQPGYVPAKLGQDNLGWESTGTLNLGLDFSLFKGRIVGDINLYKTNTTDLLLNRTISLVHGITSITQNIGKTENKGIEITLNTRNIESKNFTWSTTGNFSYLKNKIKSLYGYKEKNGKEINDVANSWFIGQPILVNYDYVWNGVWQLNEAADASKWNSQPGFAKLKDVVEDGKLTAEDRQIIGQRDPKLLWGMSNIFTYKNFSLEIFIHGVHGITKENRLLQDASASSEVRRNVMSKNWWTPENPTNDFYANAVNAEKMGGISAVIYENASFIRIKDISLAYDLPATLLSKASLNRLRVYVTGRNLVTFTKWTGSDPELNYGRGALPLQREIVFGLNVQL